MHEKTKQTIAQASRSFEKHELIKSAEDRWLIQEKYPDGTPSSIFATEIICVWPTQLYVGGDIDHIIFAYGPRDPVARILWIGGHGFDGYVCEKARIGMGTPLSDWSYDIALPELVQLVKEYNEERNWSDEAAEDFVSRLQIEEDYQELFISSLQDTLPHDYWDSMWESVMHIGQIPSASVIYAHAAVHKLCQLLGV